MTAKSDKWQNAERKAARLVGAAPPRKRARKGALYEFARRCQICIYVYHFSPILLSFKSCHRFAMQLKKQGYSDEDVAAHEGTECDAGTSYIHAAAIGEMLLHFLSVVLLHIVEESCSIIPIGYVLQVSLSQCCEFRDLGRS